MYVSAHVQIHVDNFGSPFSGGNFLRPDLLLESDWPATARHPPASASPALTTSRYHRTQCYLGPDACVVDY